jgi:hypothetical protein
LNSPNEDSLFGDDDFSHATCINHCTLKLWFKPKNVKHIQISFYENFDVSIIQLFPTCMWPTFCVTNFKHSEY